MYIDGYNFYYSIKLNKVTTPIHLAWCDFGKLARQFMVPAGGVLSGIKYFTAPVGKFGASGGPEGGEAQRQQLWLEAVGSIDGLDIVEGYHTGSENSPRGRREKESDVNLAVSVVIDAARDRFDRAILVTGDGDQRPTVRAVALSFEKRADVWITPNQEVGFWRAAEGYRGVRVRQLTPAMLRESRLQEALDVNGRVITAPKIWRAPAT
jgi:hypothetical protein